MKIALNPIETLRRKAELRIEVHFNNIAAGNVQKDQEHAHKRDVADAVLAGAEPPVEFADEAQLMAMSPEDLARLVLSKPNDVSQRGLQRRQNILEARRATTIADLDAILVRLGINPLHEKHGSDVG